MQHFLLFAFLLVFTSNLFSQSSNEYLPLKIGNRWYYNTSQSDPTQWGQFRVRVTITDTVHIGNLKFYIYNLNVVKISGTAITFASGMFLFGNVSYPIRYDTTTLNISFNYNPCVYSPNEQMADSLNARLNDDVYHNCHGSVLYKCIDTSSGTKVFYKPTLPPPSLGRTYKKGVGLISSSYYYPAPIVSYNETLIGWVVDGIAFGDTSSLVGLNVLNSNVPDKFSLSQNYPNPFNPSTKIRFEIPSVTSTEMSQVQIKVYNVQGKEVSTLVNESLQPGSYEIIFDAENYPSGTYFYILQAGDYTETRKMVLIK